MNKSMYSLILMDDLVKMVDRLAYERGTSRSNLINQILAQYLSFVTPEKRMEDIFNSVMTVANGENSLQMLSQASAGMLQVKSVLKYKYNPTIRYTVEITPSGGRYTGNFRVLSRTQSAALKSHLNVFFEIWAQMEHYCLTDAGKAAPKYEISDGRYQRTLQVEQEKEIWESALLGNAIGSYIQLFDKALELYFSADSGMDMKIYQQIIALYKGYLSESPIHL